VRSRWQQRRRLRGRLRGLFHCRLLGAVVLLQEVPVQALERVKGGEHPNWWGPGGRSTAWQPDLMSEAGKGAQEGNTPGVGRV
jgi:hypothetical protein